jgi:hypothetical protein
MISAGKRRDRDVMAAPSAIPEVKCQVAQEADMRVLDIDSGA